MVRSLEIVGDIVVGIEVGVTKVTFSNGEVEPVGHRVPQDLLSRIADDLPISR